MYKWYNFLLKGLPWPRVSFIPDVRWGQGWPVTVPSRPGKNRPVNDPIHPQWSLDGLGPVLAFIQLDIVWTFVSFFVVFISDGVVYLWFDMLNRAFHWTRRLGRNVIWYQQGNSLFHGVIHHIIGFSEVADLRFVYWHDMRGRIDTRLLSKRTKYVVYLVFKVAGGSYGLENANAFVRFIDCESNDEAEERASVVSISVQPGENRHKRRVDGWLEIEMGNFFNDAGEDGDVEARLMETRRIFTKGGLIVQGMEFRPE
ncbi:F-box protein PP2-B11 isoform X2 [Capsicum annuum]|uniref:F-box protein PP2-B11 isoform X2 n=1 Tax=Capsicum annuum TaxID=4072 RepID=UPI001FB08A04|nr:F-box protein PP2-B11 isoform X2 [Capsicum annuum]